MAFLFYIVWIYNNISAYMPMKQIEQHIISNTKCSYKFLDTKAILSKDLYNAAMLYINSIYESEKHYCNFYEINKIFVNINKLEYRALAANVSQQVLMQVDRCWKSYFKALAEYKKNPSKFKTIPQSPRLKDKEWQRNMLTYTQRVISIPALRHGKIVLNSEDTGLTTNLRSINQVQIVPLKTGQYKIILIYEKEAVPKVKSKVYAGCDMGVNNLMTIGFNDKSITPIVVSGGPLKSMNQYYHKKKAELQTQLLKNRKTSKRLRKLEHKHNMKVNDFIHKASRAVVNKLAEHKVSKIVIGYNPEWKQSINLGRRNNQNFVSIPYLKIVNAVSYKNELAGIESMVREESYTSKCSFLDDEKCRKKSKYLGKRVKRGMFVSNNGTLINADLNSAYNILRKEVPDAFSEGIEGVLVHPARLQIAN